MTKVMMGNEIIFIHTHCAVRLTSFALVWETNILPVSLVLIYIFFYIV